MTWMRRWERLDPCIVAMARQEHRLKQQRTELTEDPFGAIREKGIVVMTTDDSEQIEQLLMTWYRWAKSYRPHLGAPKVSVYGKGSPGSDGYGDDGDHVDMQLSAIEAETVDCCLNELTWQARAAVGIHAANRACGNDVFRNPHLTPEQQHQQYQRAKLDLLPLLKRKGLMRGRDEIGYTSRCPRVGAA